MTLEIEKLFKKVLVVAAHADDEIECAGTISRFVDSGAEVFYLLLSRRLISDGSVQNTIKFAQEDLDSEVINCLNVLGVNGFNILYYPNRFFQLSRAEILDEFVRINNKMKPDLVLLPMSTDIHQDHKVVAEEGLRAFKKTSIFGYEMIQNSVMYNSYVRAFIEIKEHQLIKKIQAARQYVSQQGREFLSESVLMSMATVRGVQVGCRYAEAFEIQRLVLK